MRCQLCEEWKDLYSSVVIRSRELESELARERELNQGLRKEMSALQDELFEMCKLVHKYQNELWTDAKIKADALLEDKSKPVVTEEEQEWCPGCHLVNRNHLRDCSTRNSTK